MNIKKVVCSFNVFKFIYCFNIVHAIQKTTFQKETNWTKSRVNSCISDCACMFSNLRLLTSFEQETVYFPDMVTCRPIHSSVLSFLTQHYIIDDCKSFILIRSSGYDRNCLKEGLTLLEPEVLPFPEFHSFKRNWGDCISWTEWLKPNSSDSIITCGFGSWVIDLWRGLANMRIQGCVCFCCFDAGAPSAGLI